MSNKNKVTPFLRWAGSKRKSIEFLTKNFPINYKPQNIYYEPFLGAGHLFLSFIPRKASLSDLNKDLIECYKAIQLKPIEVWNNLNELAINVSEDQYYKIRELYNKSLSSILKAAMFIYLNKTCFNGIWRVNKKGKFNVPYGHKKSPFLPSKNDIITFSNALKFANLEKCDYKEAVKSSKKGDFIYFDPPYPPLNNTSNFTKYTKENFGKKEHEDLYLLAKKLTEKGCFVLISNAKVDFIMSLFGNDFYINEFELTRWISANGRRYKVKEVAIKNYL